MIEVGDQERVDIAFIGTGLMGAPMAMRLLSAGFALAVWNRTAGKTQDLLARGARGAKTPADAARAADLVITMLADGQSVTDVLLGNGFAAAMSSNSIVLDMSSIPPALARDHASRLSAHGVRHLDAPVSGGTRGAAEGTLAIMVGGLPEAYEAVRPVLRVLGRPTLVGPSGSGQLAKLANQAIVAVTIGAVAEALLMAAAGGADPSKVREALIGGFADSMVLKQHGQRMLGRDWIPGGRMRTHLKDMRTLTAMASQMDLHLPLASRAAELFESGVKVGWGEFDHSALLLEIERLNPGVRVGDRPDHYAEQP
jgi:2-hydroxy-3-oxopropionate reductase